MPYSNPPIQSAILDCKKDCVQLHQIRLLLALSSVTHSLMISVVSCGCWLGIIPVSPVVSRILWRKALLWCLMGLEQWVRTLLVNVFPVCLCRTACGRRNFWLPERIGAEWAGQMEEYGVRAASIFQFPILTFLKQLY